MANIDNLATNQDLIAIANGIRHATRTTEPMTISQMSERLGSIRVIERGVVKASFNAQGPLLLGVYNTLLAHFFIAMPRANKDADTVALVVPETRLNYNAQTGELYLEYKTPVNAEAEIIVLDMLLSKGEVSEGIFLSMHDNSSKVKAEDLQKEVSRAQAVEVALGQRVDGVNSRIDNAAQAITANRADLSSLKQSLKDLDNIRRGAALGATAVQSLAGVATEQWVNNSGFGKVSTLFTGGVADGFDYAELSSCKFVIVHGYAEGASSSSLMTFVFVPQVLADEAEVWTNDIRVAKQGDIVRWSFGGTSKFFATMIVGVR
nr:MAG TPA: hypothetical protein [Caudoviricetes sp.]